MNNDLIAKNLNQIKFQTPYGHIRGNEQDWGIYNTETDSWLSFTGVTPCIPNGGRKTAVEVAATLIRGNNKWVKALA